MNTWMREGERERENIPMGWREEKLTLILY
jgi:hypothetical protein